jgi:hypothetical protein
MKYNSDEVRELKDLGELPEHVEIGEDADMEFMEGSDDEEGKEEDDFDIKDI